MKVQLFLVFLLFSFTGKSQDCNAVQQLSDLSPYVSMLDTALKYEDFAAVDSLNFRIQEILASEAGQPDAAETYYTLTSNTAWLDLPDALLLARALIDQAHAANQPAIQRRARPDPRGVPLRELPRGSAATGRLDDLGPGRARHGGPVALPGLGRPALRRADAPRA